VVSATIPTVVKLGFLDRSRYFSIQVAHEAIEPGTSESVARNADH
jgi:hypothetical protein